MESPNEEWALGVEASHLADIIDSQIPLGGPKIEVGVDGALQMPTGGSTESRNATTAPLPGRP